MPPTPTVQFSGQIIADAELAISVLEKEIHRIQTIQDWATVVGCSRTTLNRNIQKSHRRTPFCLIRSTRYNRIVMLIQHHPSITAFAVAIDVGLKNEKSLYKFLIRHYLVNFTELKRFLHLR
jgi:methylphosphotriester-DNA--protein-cysteine methyltransferase